MMTSLLLILSTVLTGPLTGSIDRGQTAALAHGTIVTTIGDAPAAHNLSQGTAVAVVDAAPARVFAVCTDYARFPEFMPYIADARVNQHNGDRTIASFRVQLPVLGARHYQLEYTDTREGTGIGTVYTSRWRYTGVGDIAAASGSWQIGALDGGARSLVRYSVVSATGGVPHWIADPFARHALQKVIEAVRHRAVAS